MGFNITEGSPRPVISLAITKIGSEKLGVPCGCYGRGSCGMKRLSQNKAIANEVCDMNLLLLVFTTLGKLILLSSFVRLKQATKFRFTHVTSNDLYLYAQNSTPKAIPIPIFIIDRRRSSLHSYDRLIRFKAIASNFAVFNSSYTGRGPRRSRSSRYKTRRRCH